MIGEPLLGLEWSAPEHPEILVKAILAHGDDDVFAEKVMRFWDGEIGRPKASLVIAALPILSRVLRKHPPEKIDDEKVIAALVAKELDSSADTKELDATANALWEIIEDLVVPDLKYDDQWVRIIGMRIEHRTPQGTRHAVFSTSEGGTVKHYVKAFDREAVDYYLKDSV